MSILRNLVLRMRFRNFLITLLCSILLSGSFYSQRLIPYRKGKLWGYADSNGVIKIKPKYDHADQDDCGLLRVSIDKNWGILNREGSVVIPVEYTSVIPSCEDWNGGVFIVRQGDYVQIFSRDEKKLLVAGNFQVDNRPGPNILIKDGNRYGLLNNKGNWLVEPNEDWIEVSDGGYYIFEKNGETHFYDPSGKLLFKKALIHHSPFAKGYARVTYRDAGASENTKTKALTELEDYYYNVENILDHNGKLLLPKGYRTNTIGPFGGWMPVRGPKNLMGIIDSLGKLVVPDKYDDIESWRGFITVKKNNLHGFVTPGTWRVAEPVYSSVEKFNGILYIVRKDQQYKLVDTNGNQVYEDFDWINNEYKTGFSAGRKDRLYWMNKKGTIILEMDTMNYRYGYPFRENHALVYHNDRAGMIDENGRQIVAPVFRAIYNEGPGLFRVYGSARGNFYKQAGIMNADGKMIIDTVHQQTFVSRNKKHLLVQDNDLWGLYDLYGKELLPRIYTGIHQMDNGTYTLEKPNPDFKYVPVAVPANGYPAGEEPPPPKIPPHLYYIANTDGKILGQLPEFPIMQGYFIYLQTARGWMRFDGKKFYED